MLKKKNCALLGLGILLGGTYEILKEKNMIAIRNKDTVLAVGDEAYEMYEKAELARYNLEKKENNTQAHRIILPIKQMNKTWRWAMSIAASVLIVLSAGIFAYFGNSGNRNQMLVDTFSNPEEAYIETQKTLLLVSGKLNKGIQQVEKVNDIIDKDVQL